MLSHSQSEPQGHFNETDTESLGHRDGCGGFFTDNTQSYNSSKRSQPNSMVHFGVSSLDCFIIYVFLNIQYVTRC